MNNIIISVVFPRTEENPVKDVINWSEKFDDKLIIENIDYDKDWTPTTSRVEFKGIYKDK